MLPGIYLWNNLQQLFWLFLFSVKFSVLIVFVLEIRREGKGRIRAIQSQIWIKKGENHFWNFSCCKKNCSLLFLKLDDHHFRHRKTETHLSSYKAPVKYSAICIVEQGGRGERPYCHLLERRNSSESLSRGHAINRSVQVRFRCRTNLVLGVFIQRKTLCPSFCFEPR